MGIIEYLKITTGQTDLSQNQLTFNFLKRSINIPHFCIFICLSMVYMKHKDFFKLIFKQLKLHVWCSYCILLLHNGIMVANLENSFLIEINRWYIKLFSQVFYCHRKDNAPEFGSNKHFCNICHCNGKYCRKALVEGYITNFMVWTKPIFQTNKCTPVKMSKKLLF